MPGSSRHPGSFHRRHPVSGHEPRWLVGAVQPCPRANKVAPDVPEYEWDATLVASLLYGVSVTPLILNFASDTEGKVPRQKETNLLLGFVAQGFS